MSAASNRASTSKSVTGGYELDPKLSSRRTAAYYGGRDDNDEMDGDEYTDEDDGDDQDEDEDAGDTSLDDDTDAEDEYQDKFTRGNVVAAAGPSSNKRLALSQGARGSSPVNEGEENAGTDFARIVDAVRASGLSGGSQNALNQVFDKTIEDELDLMDDDPFFRKGKSKGKRGPANPEASAEVKNLLGQANKLYAQQNLEGAVPFLQEVVRIDPGTFHAWNLLATIHEELGEVQKANSFKLVGLHLVSVKSAAKMWHELGTASNNFGQVQQAIYCFAKAIAGNKNNVDAMFDRAFLLKFNGATRQASTAFSKILTLHPHHTIVMRELAPLLIEQAQTTKVIELYTAAFRFYQQEFSYRNYRPEDDLEDAAARFGLPDILLLANCLKQEKEWTKLIKIVRSGARWLDGREREVAWDSLADDREFDLERRTRTDASRMAGNFESAPIYDLDDRLRLLLGIARLAEGNIAEAQIHFNILLEVEDEALLDNVDNFLQVVDAYCDNKKFEEAIDILDRLTQNEPTNEPAIWGKLARCYIGIQEYEEASKLLVALVEAEPDNLEAKMDLARTYEMLNAGAKALDMVKQILAAGARLREAGKALPSGYSSFKGAKRVPQEKTVVLTKDERMRKAAESAALENSRVQDFALAFERLELLDVNVQDEDSEDRREWLTLATILVDSFRETVQLFPADTKKKFAGVLSRSWGRKGVEEDDLEAQAGKMSERLNRSLAAADEDLESDSFRGLNFDAWLSFIIKYAFLLARNDEHEAAQETLSHVQGASVFRQSPSKTLAIRLARCACYLLVKDYNAVVGIGRWMCASYPYQSDPLCLFMALVSSGTKAIEALNSSSLQKSNLRILKAIYAQVKNGESGDKELAVDEVGGAVDGDDDDYKAVVDFRPTQQNPLQLMVHGYMLLTSRSYQSAIMYFLKAYKVTSEMPLLNLCLGVAYLHRAMQRQTDNRHHQISQAMTFFTQYRKLRGEGQEVEYNFGRAFHHLGLGNLAIHHYEACLAYAVSDRAQLAADNADTAMADDDDDDDGPDDFACVAAYNLSRLHLYAGSPDLAKKVARDWLSV